MGADAINNEITNTDVLDALIPQKSKRPLDIAVVAHMLVLNYSLAEIGRLHGISRQAVHDYVQRNNAKLYDLTHGGDKLRAKRYEAIADKMLGQISERDLSKDSTGTLMTCAAIATDKSRLLSDKSTQNISSLTKLVQSVEPVKD